MFLKHTFLPRAVSASPRDQLAIFLFARLPLLCCFAGQIEHISLSPVERWSAPGRHCTMSSRRRNISQAEHTCRALPGPGSAPADVLRRQTLLPTPGILYCINIVRDGQPFPVQGQRCPNPRGQSIETQWNLCA